MRGVLYSVDGAGPVIGGSVVLELECADGVRNALDCIRDGVGEVVHGVHAPLVARSGMFCELDPVEGGVTHVDVGAGHVQLGPQEVLAFGVFAFAHFLEELEVLLDASVAVGAVLARSGEGSAVFLDLLGSLAVNIGKALLDQVDCNLMELVVVVRGVVFVIAPVEAEPPDIALDGVDVLHVFLGGVRVVKSEMAYSVVFLCKTEVQADALDVSHVQVAVGLGRESGNDCVVGNSAVGKVVFDDLLDEVEALFLLGSDFFAHDVLLCPSKGA